jgi:hypothetical protein
VLKTASLYRAFGPLIYARCRRALVEQAAVDHALNEVFSLVLPALDPNNPRSSVAAIARVCDEVTSRSRSSA